MSNFEKYVKLTLDQMRREDNDPTITIKETRTHRVGNRYRITITFSNGSKLSAMLPRECEP